MRVIAGLESRWIAVVFVCMMFGHVETVADAATVRVATSSNASNMLPGETATITVSAVVQNPASSDDGIFTFDLDLINGDPSVLEVVAGSLSRPGVDPIFGGSNGTPQLWGVNAIAGGYAPTNLGIGIPKVLFTLDVRALAPGVVNVAAGPDTDVMGVDFLLNQSASPNIDYSGASISIAVPEPFFLHSIGIIACSLAGRPRRLDRRTVHVR